MLWTNEAVWDLSLIWVSWIYPIYNSWYCTPLWLLISKRLWKCWFRSQLSLLITYFCAKCFNLQDWLSLASQSLVGNKAPVLLIISHDDVIKWKHFPRHWSFVRGIHRSSMNSPHKGQWRGAFIFPLICILNKLLSKQSWGWWFETLSRSLWCHCNVFFI